MKLTKKSIYIGLFGVLYLIVAFSSFWHACAFFGLANTSWMSIILAFAFEVGQAAVLFSLLTSEKDRGRIMPWVLMTMFTLVQVVGNVFSSYKYIITNSVENLRYFKEPIFIWTTLPDDQATVIVTYVVGAILPVAALLLTSMITNYLSDQEEEKNKLVLMPQITSENGPKKPPIELKNREDFLNVYGDKDEQNCQLEDEEPEKVKESENDKETLKTQETPQEEYKKEKPDEGVINNEETSKESINEEPTRTTEIQRTDGTGGETTTTEDKSNNDNERWAMVSSEDQKGTQDTTSEDSKQENNEVHTKSNEENPQEIHEDPEKVMVPEDEEPEKVQDPEDEDPEKVMVPEDEDPEKVMVPEDKEPVESNELKSHFVNI